MSFLRQSNYFPILFLLLISLATIILPIHGDDEESGNEGNGGNVVEPGPQNDAIDGEGYDGGNLTIANFMDGLSEQGHQDLLAIFANQSNLTKDEMNKKLDNWAKQQKTPPNFYTVYLALEKAYEDVKAEFDARHTQLMANPNVTDEVRAADQKIRAIANNQFITPVEEASQIAAAMASFPENVQTALKQMAPYPIQIQPQQQNGNNTK